MVASEKAVGAIKEMARLYRVDIGSLVFVGRVASVGLGAARP